MNAAIVALLEAWVDFVNYSAGDALRRIMAYGKKDTLGMDAGPEITICAALNRYDAGAIVITEEIGARGGDDFRPYDTQTLKTVFVSDPTDRSNQLKAFLAMYPPEMRIGDIFADPASAAKWEESFSGPASITGATSAISCVRRGRPIFSVIINYITQELFVSCAAGNRVVKLPTELPERVDLDYVCEHGTLIVFPCMDGSLNSMLRFTTFLGDVGKIGYRENFLDSGLMDEAQLARFLHYDKPGGPSRVLYLSSLQPNTTRVGFVLANGEKIGEWIHWLPFVWFARSQYDDSQPALVLYEVFQDRPWTKDGVLMSTPPNYSVFREIGGSFYIDTSLLLRMPNPSRLRATLIIAPHDNRWAMRLSSQSGYRTIRF